MQIILGKNWYQLEHNQVVQLLNSDMDFGLDRFEVEHRQSRFGNNQLQEKKKESPIIKFLKQFNNPLMILLVASSVITAVVKDLLDASIIFAVVLINAIVSYIQESQAEAAIEALIGSLAADSLAIRSGSQINIPASELVPGDVVILTAGDKIPADLRIIESKNLQISEASLTGESLPVAKDHTLELASDTVLGDRKNMAFASTLVTNGTGKGIVVATREYTEIGRISELIATAEQLETPLTKKIAQFSKWVLIAIIVLASAVLGINLLRGKDLPETIISAIALSVAMIPEGLPTALTVTLAIGVQRMAKRHAIIRRLPAVEALGSTTVICTDKTGTLTQNQMTVQEIYDGKNTFTVSGIGFTPDGNIVFKGKSIEKNKGTTLGKLLRSGVANNDAGSANMGEENGYSGDPTEIALLISALKAGISKQEIDRISRRLDVFPFDSQNKFMATLNQDGDDGNIIFIKGALEMLSDRIDFQDHDLSSKLSSHQKNSFVKMADDMARRGLRVLAFAYKRVPATKKQIDLEDLENGFVFLGLQGMIDPPRTEVISAIAACKTAGIGVKMITGDHPLTAATIAQQIGIIPDDDDPRSHTRTGKELDNLTDQQLIDLVEKIDVFSRVSPDQKLRLVEALQSNGNIVSMTGDGVNDGPALKQADIGIAMGITGTDVAKEAADMVLTDDNFNTIEAAVEEGRSIFDNITKIIAWTLPTNIGEGLIILLAMLIGEVLPILPIQILWINMVTVGVLGIVLALENQDIGIMERPPRDPESSIIPPLLVPRIFFVGLMILISGFWLFEWELGIGASIEVARTVAVNAVVFTEIFYLLNSRSLTYSPFKIGFFSNKWLIVGLVGMVILQLMFTYLPFMNAIFASAPLGFNAWWRLLAFASGTFVLVEVEKYFRRNKK